MRRCWHLVVLLSGCSDPAAGPCRTEADCEEGMVCSPRLGCIPREQALIDWGDGDGDADSDGDTNAEEDAGRPLLDDCPHTQADECCQLWRECTSEGDSDVCARYVEACEEAIDDGCQRDGECDPGCEDDEDCAGSWDCPDLCGPVPEASEDHCTWSCEPEDDPEGICVLVPASEDWVTERCDSAEGPGVDEDCNGLADCDDPACREEGDCP